ncbi:NUDIX domain-containing protein [Deinococcus sp. MIMF12]|uniref:NUDIX domain-containing protein n=1 Tax=Deinococcus rhizophilus TaxID=3049544 RepID=A0ABT7JG83_9DEIO|nr:NUDIX domain-containing protein [Deinococcus rhizophilus]MDL2344069.1 NUDIX domain-containing protein [Deinococcus rhizophilus]
MSLPPPDDSWYVRPPDLPGRASVGTVVLRRGGGEWQVAVVVEPGDYRQLPKGGLEPGETHEQALHRELREEAGLTAVRLVADLGVLERQNSARTRWQVTRYFLGVTGEVGVTPLEPGFRLEWHPLNAAPPLFWPEQGRLVARVRQNLAGGEYGLA